MMEHTNAGIILVVSMGAWALKVKNFVNFVAYPCYQYPVLSWSSNL